MTFIDIMQTYLRGERLGFLTEGFAEQRTRAYTAPLDHLAQPQDSSAAATE